MVLWLYNALAIPSATPSTFLFFCNSKTRKTRAFVCLCHCLPPVKHKRCAILGAGFAGMSVAWHLLQHSSQISRLSVDIIDEVGIAGGASGASGGLLHPFSPKGKLLWHGMECWKESLNLVSIAEAAVAGRLQREDSSNSLEISSDPIAWRRGILRIPVNAKSVHIMQRNVQDSMQQCKISCINSMAAKKLLPEVTVPTDFALYFPEAINVHPERYLKGLLLACLEKAKALSNSGFLGTKVRLIKKEIGNLFQLSEDYDIVVVCLGAKACLLPELEGKLPICPCRGVVAHIELPGDIRETYAEDAPSVLSNAWLAAQGPRKLVIGSTKVWGSSNFCSDVSSGEASSAFEEIFPKISMVFPSIERWKPVHSAAGVRAVPPPTSLGTLPIIGCIDNLMKESVGKTKLLQSFTENSVPKYWIVTGFGSRGLIYHGYVGKLIAKAIITGDHDSLPAELISWLHRNNKL